MAFAVVLCSEHTPTASVQKSDLDESRFDEVIEALMMAAEFAAEAARIDRRDPSIWSVSGLVAVGLPYYDRWMTDNRDYQISYLPYLGMADRDEISDGDLTIWNADRQLANRVSDPAFRGRVRALLNMNVEMATAKGSTSAVLGIGVISIGPTDCRPFSIAEQNRVREAQLMLFAASLSQDARVREGRNAGHWLRASENVAATFQGFRMDRDSVAEEVGQIITRRIMGYQIGEARFVRPSYVPHPMIYRHDELMFEQLRWLRRCDKGLFRRVLRAIGMMMAAHYNANSVDIQSRILSQATAFEVLLDLPEQKQRLAFKTRIEELLNDRRSEPTFRFRSERLGGKREMERRSAKGMWADRFYTLRNHIIHGNVVRRDEYRFRGQQHHHTAAVRVFVAALSQTIDRARIARGAKRVFFSSLRWERWEDDNDMPPTNHAGFVVKTDIAAQVASACGVPIDELWQGWPKLPGRQ
ncbi:MAG TPA: hypothetical protein VGM77_12320 [Gemmatimonadales bacterium]|jgi:hypothetical protein